MERKLTAGERLDRLPISKWHYRLLVVIGAGLFVDGVDNYMGSAVLSELIQLGWSTNYLNAAFISFTMLGLFCGSLLTGYVGDRFGRKFAYQLNLLIFGIAGLIGAFSPNMYFLIACRFVMGIGLGAEIIVGFGMFAEMISAKVRGQWSSYLSLIGNMAAPVGMLLCYLIIPAFGWRVMFFTGGLLALLVWFPRQHMPESPRWHESKGHPLQADTILESIEKEIETEKGIKLHPYTTDHVFYKEPVAKNTFGWMDLFKGEVLRRNVIASVCLVAMNTLIYTIINWLPTIFVHQGISVTKSVGMVTLMMVGAPVGVIISAYLADRFSRKHVAVTLLLLISVMCYIYSAQRDDVLIMTSGFVMTVLIYFFVCFVCSVYVPELFPTEIRLRGMGFSNAVGRFSAVISPYVVAYLITDHGIDSVFHVLTGFLLVCAAIIYFLGIESRGKSLEEVNEYAVLNKS